MQRTLGCHPRVCKSTARAPHAVLPTPALPRFSLLPAEPQAFTGRFRDHLRRRVPALGGRAGSTRVWTAPERASGAAGVTTGRSFAHVPPHLALFQLLTSETPGPFFHRQISLRGENVYKWHLYMSDSLGWN